MECSFFFSYFLFFVVVVVFAPMPDHHSVRLHARNLQWDFSGIIFNLRTFRMHHTTGHIQSFFVSVPADLFILFLCPDRLQHHNRKWCRQCTSLFFHHLLQLLMVCILRGYIAQKNEEGRKNSMCHKNTKIQFHTCDRDPSTYHEYDIHKLLTLLYYSTYTILKLVPALRYVFPHDANVLSTNTQQICSTTVQKPSLKSQGIFDASLKFNLILKTRTPLHAWKQNDKGKKCLKLTEKHSKNIPFFCWTVQKYAWKYLTLSFKKMRSVMYQNVPSAPVICRGF